MIVIVITELESGYVDKTTVFNAETSIQYRDAEDYFISMCKSLDVDNNIENTDEDYDDMVRERNYSVGKYSVNISLPTVVRND